VFIVTILCSFCCHLQLWSCGAVFLTFQSTSVLFYLHLSSALPSAFVITSSIHSLIPVLGLPICTGCSGCQLFKSRWPIQLSFIAVTCSPCVTMCLCHNFIGGLKRSMRSSSLMIPGCSLLRCERGLCVCDWLRVFWLMSSGEVHLRANTVLSLCIVVNLHAQSSAGHWHRTI